MAANNGTFSAFLRSYNAQVSGASAPPAQSHGARAELAAALAALAEELRAASAVTPEERDDTAAKTKASKKGQRRGAKVIKQKSRARAEAGAKPVRKAPARQSKTGRSD